MRVGFPKVVPFARVDAFLQALRSVSCKAVLILQIFSHAVLVHTGRHSFEAAKSRRS